MSLKTRIIGRTTGIVAVTAAACLTLSACSSTVGAVDASTAGTATLEQLTEGMTFDPQGKSIRQIAAALESGEATSQQLVAYYLERIDRYDDQGPSIHAITQINRLALRQAYLRDLGRKDEAQHDPLYGIPFVVKDNIDVEGMNTTAGSMALKDNKAKANATVVDKLVKRGAIVLAKTNMSELAASYGWLGYSSYGGQTRNPYNLKRDPSGSSSGTAAAVAAGFAPFGLGSDTSGSVRAPASVTGLVGMRVTYGQASRSGVIPLSDTFDQTGAITSNVQDQAIVLDAITGPDDHDPVTAQATKNPQYGQHLSQTSLKHTRIGVVDLFNGGNKDVDRTFEEAQQNLSKAGATLVDITLDDSYANLWGSIMGPVGDAEFVTDYETYMRYDGASKAKTVRQLIDKSKALAHTDTPVNPARIKGYETNMKASASFHGDKVQSIILEKIPKLTAKVQKLMADNQVDALIYPTISCPASVRHDAKDPTYQCDSDDPYTASYLASSAHLPEITVPAGRDGQNMPIGLSFTGAQDSEQTLLALAAQYEAISPYRNGQGLQLD